MYIEGEYGYNHDAADVPGDCLKPRLIVPGLAA